MYKLLCSNLTKSHRSLSNFTRYYRKVAQKCDNSILSCKKYLSETELHNNQTEDNNEGVDCSEDPVEVEPTPDRTKSYTSFFAHGIKKAAALGYSKMGIENATGATSSVPARLFHSTDINKKSSDIPKKRPFKNKEAEGYYQSAVEQCMEIKHKLDRYYQQASWVAKPPKPFYNMKYTYQNTNEPESGTYKSTYQAPKYEESHQVTTPELHKIYSVKTSKPTFQFKQSNVKITYPTHSVRYKMGTQGYRLQHKVRHQVSNDEKKTVFKNPLLEQMQTISSRHTKVTEKEKIHAVEAKNRMLQRKIPVLADMLQKNYIKENSEQDKQIKKLEKAMIKMHPTVKKANASVKMAFRNTYNRLLMKSGLVYHGPIKNKEREKVRPKEDTVLSEKEEEEEEQYTAPGTSLIEKHCQDRAVRDPEEQMEVSEEQISEHPIASNKQDKADIPVKFVKRILSDKPDNFDIDAVCIKSNTNNNTTTTCGNYVVESEEKVKNFVDMHKQEASIKKGPQRQRIKPRALDYEAGKANDTISKYLLKLKELRDQTALDKLKVKMQNKMGNAHKVEGRKIKDIVKKYEEEIENSTTNKNQGATEELIDTQDEQRELALEQSDRHPEQRRDKFRYRLDKTNDLQRDRFRSQSVTSLRKEKGTKLKAIKSENLTKKMKWKTFGSTMSETEARDVVNPLEKILDQYLVPTKPEVTMSAAEINRLNRKRQREREKKLMEDVKMMQKKLDEDERNTLKKEGTISKHKYNLNVAKIKSYKLDMADIKPSPEILDAKSDQKLTDSKLNVRSEDKIIQEARDVLRSVAEENRKQTMKDPMLVRDLKQYTQNLQKQQLIKSSLLDTRKVPEETKTLKEILKDYISKEHDKKLKQTTSSKLSLEKQLEKPLAAAGLGDKSKQIFDADKKGDIKLFDKNISLTSNTSGPSDVPKVEKAEDFIETDVRMIDNLFSKIPKLSLEKEILERVPNLSQVIHKQLLKQEKTGEELSLEGSNPSTARDLPGGVLKQEDQELIKKDAEKPGMNMKEKQDSLLKESLEGHLGQNAKSLEKEADKTSDQKNLKEKDSTANMKVQYVKKQNKLPAFGVSMFKNSKPSSNETIPQSLKQNKPEKQITSRESSPNRIDPANKTHQENLKKLKDASTRLVKLAKKIDLIKGSDIGDGEKSEKSTIPDQRPTIRRDRPPADQDKSKKDPKSKKEIVLPPKDHSPPGQYTNAKNYIFYKKESHLKDTQKKPNKKTYDLIPMKPANIIKTRDSRTESACLDVSKTDIIKNAKGTTKKEEPKRDIIANINDVVRISKEPKKHKSLADLAKEQREKILKEIDMTWEEEQKKTKQKSDDMENESKDCLKEEIDKDFGVAVINRRRYAKDYLQIKKKPNDSYAAMRLDSVKSHGTIQNNTPKKECPLLVVQLKYNTSIAQIKPSDSKTVMIQNNVKNVEVMKSNSAIGGSLSLSQHFSFNKMEGALTKHTPKNTNKDLILIPTASLTPEDPLARKTKKGRIEDDALKLQTTNDPAKKNTSLSAIADDTKSKTRIQLPPRDVLWHAQNDLDFCLSQMGKGKIENDQYSYSKTGTEKNENTALQEVKEKSVALYAVDEDKQRMPDDKWRGKGDSFLNLAKTKRGKIEEDTFDVQPALVLVPSEVIKYEKNIRKQQLEDDVKKPEVAAPSIQKFDNVTGSEENDQQYPVLNADVLAKEIAKKLVARVESIKAKAELVGKAITSASDGDIAIKPTRPRRLKSGLRRKVRNIRNEELDEESSEGSPQHKAACCLVTRMQTKPNKPRLSRQLIRKNNRLKKTGSKKSLKEDPNIKKLLNAMKQADNELEEVLKSYEIFKLPQTKGLMEEDNTNVESKLNQKFDADKTNIFHKSALSETDLETDIEKDNVKKGKKYADSFQRKEEADKTKKRSLITEGKMKKLPEKSTNKSVISYTALQKLAKIVTKDGKVNDAVSSGKNVLTTGDIKKETKNMREKKEGITTGSANSPKFAASKVIDTRVLKKGGYSDLNKKGAQIHNKKDTGKDTSRSDPSGLKEGCKEIIVKYTNSCALTDSDDVEQDIAKKYDRNSCENIKGTSDNKLLLQTASTSGNKIVVTSSDNTETCGSISDNEDKLETDKNKEASNKLFLQLVGGNEMSGNKIVATNSADRFEDCATKTVNPVQQKEIVVNTVEIPGKKTNNVNVAKALEMQVSMPTDHPHDTSTLQNIKKIQHCEPTIEKYQSVPKKGTDKAKKQQNEDKENDSETLNALGPKKVEAQRMRQQQRIEKIGQCEIIQNNKRISKLAQPKKKAQFKIYRSSLIDMFINTKEKPEEQTVNDVYYNPKYFWLKTVNRPQTPNRKPKNNPPQDKKKPRTPNAYSRKLDGESFEVENAFATAIFAKNEQSQLPVGTSPKRKKEVTKSRKDPSQTDFGDNQTYIWVPKPYNQFWTYDDEPISKTLGCQTGDIFFSEITQKIADTQTSAVDSAVTDSKNEELEKVSHMNKTVSRTKLPLRKQLRYLKESKKKIRNGVATLEKNMELLTVLEKKVMAELSGWMEPEKVEEESDVDKTDHIQTTEKKKVVSKESEKILKPQSCDRKHKPVENLTEQEEDKDIKEIRELNKIHRNYKSRNDYLNKACQKVERVLSLVKDENLAFDGNKEHEREKIDISVKHKLAEIGLLENQNATKQIKSARRNNSIVDINKQKQELVKKPLNLEFMEMLNLNAKKASNANSNKKKRITYSLPTNRYNHNYTQSNIELVSSVTKTADGMPSKYYPLKANTGLSLTSVSSNKTNKKANAEEKNKYKYTIQKIRQLFLRNSMPNYNQLRPPVIQEEVKLMKPLHWSKKQRAVTEKADKKPSLQNKKYSQLEAKKLAFQATDILARVLKSGKNRENPSDTRQEVDTVNKTTDKRKKTPVRRNPMKVEDYLNITDAKPNYFNDYEIVAMHSKNKDLFSPSQKRNKKGNPKTLPKNKKNKEDIFEMLAAILKNETDVSGNSKIKTNSEQISTPSNQNEQALVEVPKQRLTPRLAENKGVSDLIISKNEDIDRAKSSKMQRTVPRRK